MTDRSENHHGVHCDGCRELTFIVQRDEAMAAAKAAFAALPAQRRVELEERFDLARMQAQHHVSYRREW